VTEQEARERLATARVARLATVGPNGRPHLVPIVFAARGNTVYSVVDDKPKRTTALKRLDNVRANPSVSLLADHYEEDWSRLWWVRADGTARVLEPGTPEAEEAIALLRERYPRQRATGAVLAIDVRRWSGWSAG
jgi:PPOX class probable F420-dependent enzyme